MFYICFIVLCIYWMKKMSVTVFSWNYHIKKNLDYLCNNKTPGHYALEIIEKLKLLKKIILIVVKNI